MIKLLLKKLINTCLPIFHFEAKLQKTAAFPITNTFRQNQLSRFLQRGNTVQPMLPCWVVPTAGSLSIMASLYLSLRFKNMS